MCMSRAVHGRGAIIHPTKRDSLDRQISGPFPVRRQPVTALCKLTGPRIEPILRQSDGGFRRASYAFEFRGLR